MLWRNFVGYSELLAEWNNGLIRKSIVAGINIFVALAAGWEQPSKYTYIIKNFQKRNKKGERLGGCDANYKAR